MIKTTKARCICLAALLLGLVVGTMPTIASAQSRPAPNRDRETHLDAAQQQLDAAMREKIAQILAPDGKPLSAQEFSNALSEADSLLEQAAWYADASNTDLFRELSRGARLLRLMVDGRQTNNAELWAMLMDHPELSDSVAFAIQPGRDDIPEAMLVLDSLRRQFGPEKLTEYSNLTAALCAVHDQRRPAPGRQPTTSASVNELWAYYTRYENKMAFGIKGMPVDLLAHVVDTTSSIREMQWALDRYGRDQQVGNRYGEIMYDDNAMATSAPKRIDSETYTLQNIRRVGGVCAEQAYFASHVGKAMGIPTVELSSVGSSMSHAWLGYLRVRGRQAAWDFDTGCYEEYKKYVGDFRDPLSGKKYEDGHAAFLSIMIGVQNDSLHKAVALHDATIALAGFDASSDSPKLTVSIEGDEILNPVRSPDPTGLSELLAASLDQAGAERRVWQLASKLSEDKRIGSAEIEKFFTALEKICGRNEVGYFALMAPQLLWAIEDVRAQGRMYDRVARAVRQKPEREANVRFAQGDDLLRREMFQEAMAVYLLPTRTRNLDGPWTLSAVDRVTALLRKTNKQQHLADVIGDIFKKVPRPSTEGSHTARTGSVWAQVGERYYNALLISGRRDEAADLRRQLDTILRRVDLPLR